MAYFDGQLAIVHRSGGQINVYYDGAFAPWTWTRQSHWWTPGQEYRLLIRLPESKGGQVIVDNSWGTMNGNDLRDHLTDF